jgi:hypothetical protein
MEHPAPKPRLRGGSRLPARPTRPPKFTGPITFTAFTREMKLSPSGDLVLNLVVPWEDREKALDLRNA